jgi:hypothetical protein
VHWTGLQVLCQRWPRRHEATNAKPVNIGFPKEILTRVLRNTNQKCQPLDWNVLIRRPQLFRKVRHSTAMLHWFAATPIYKATVTLLQVINYNYKTHSLPRRFNPRPVHVRSAVYLVVLGAEFVSENISVFPSAYPSPTLHTRASDHPVHTILNTDSVVK